MRQFLRFLTPALLAVSTTGCTMLGALFDEHPFRLIVIVVVVVAAVGFVASRSQPRW